MSQESYLQRLTGRLIEGVDRLPAEFRSRHARWILARQNPDGGFSGREGASDLYYTGFALRSLAILQALESDTCLKAAAFLRKSHSQSTSLVELFSYLVCGFLVQLGGGPDLLAESPDGSLDRIVDLLEKHRHADGGYARSAGGTSSTYTTFLVALALELLGRSIPHPERAIKFLEGRYRGGGFVEIAQMKRAGTNPTAAGVGTLQILGTLTEVKQREIGAFLASLYSKEEGGLRANDRIAAADLLSTFTGGWTLADIEQLDRLDLQALRTYAESLQGPHGGFRGGSWDIGLDVEYTFYGIGALGLLATL